MNRLEIYGALLVALALAFVGAYFKGRHDELTKVHTQQEAANAKVYQEELAASQRRAAADNAAADAAQALADRMRKGLGDLNDKFGKLPNVVVDARGCADLSDNFRLRWNAAVGLPGQPVDGASARPAPPAVPAPGLVPRP